MRNKSGKDLYNLLNSLNVFSLDRIKIIWLYVSNVG